jgi:DNA-binding LytR/AlgR family response regulator
MPLTMRQSRFPSWLKHAAAAAALGLLLGFSGPFGTNPALDRPLRYAFWGGLTLFGYLCVLVSSAVIRASPALARLPGWAHLGLAAVMSSVPQTLAVAWVFSLVQPGRVTAPAQLPALFFAVLAIQFVIAFVASLVTRRIQPAAAAVEEPAASPFLDRLPPHLRGDLIALEAQDHYLKVHTGSGSTLVLSRLSDAIAQLCAIDGLQVHRSWWVADAAVIGVQRDGGTLTLELRNGIKAPVSRTYLQAVRARGWAKG